MKSRTKINYIFALILLLTASFSNSCNNNHDYYGIPDVFINYTINLTLPKYADLNIIGGHVYLNDEGYKGVIVYHNLDDTYIAMERCCTQNPLDECSKVSVDESGIFIRCGQYDGSDFIECCGSNFNMQGVVLKGPAVYPLKQYMVTKSGDNLYITN